MSPTEKPAKPVAIYTRVSEQGRRSDEELLSHDIQRGKVEKYLAGVELEAAPEVFEDTDRSGGTMSRPAFDRAIAGVLSGVYGGIAVASLSRLGRTTIGVLTLIKEIEDVGGVVICLTPRVDTSSPEQRAMLTVFLAFVTLEREQAVVGAKSLAEKKLSEGTSTGGRAPVGYDFEITGVDSNGKDIRGWLVPNADAPHVLEAFQRCVDGQTYGRISDYLNEVGVLTNRGNQWVISSVKLLLRNEVYAGVRRYGDVRQEHAHEAIVSDLLWRRVQKRLVPADGPKTRVRGDGHVLGQGLCRCGKCGGSLSRGVANGKYPTLRCQGRGGGHSVISYAKAEDWIIGVAFAKGVGWTVERSGGNSEEIEAADASLALARDDLAEVEALKGTIRPAAFAVALSEAQAALEAAEDARDALTAKPEQERFLTAFGSRQRFEELPVPEQRGILRQIVSKVVLAPGRGSSAERIEITFTDGSLHPAPFNPDAVPSKG
jgi:DNA invertase Pin-like site-specific DNA recombinase